VKPVVMAMQGYCYTIGVELALAADVVVASRDARFTQFEVRRGIMPFGGATLRFAQVAGYQNAMRYMLTGDAFDAEEARRIGVAQEVTDAGQQVARAIAVGESIAAQAPLAVQATRGQRAAGDGAGPRGGACGADARRAGADGERGRGGGAAVLRRAARGGDGRARGGSVGGGPRAPRPAARCARAATRASTCRRSTSSRCTTRASRRYNRNCLHCHQDVLNRDDARPAGDGGPPADAAATRGRGGGRRATRTAPSATPRSTSSGERSAAHLRRQVSTRACTGCHSSGRWDYYLP
jgi:hypothetical protein